MRRTNFTDDQLSKGIASSKTEETTASLSDTPKDTSLERIEIYSLNGKVVKEHDKEAYAKKQGEKRYVKSDGGTIYDPRGLYSNDIYKKVGNESVWKWKRVGIPAFDSYIAYLERGNKSHYHNACREML